MKRLAKCLGRAGRPFMNVFVAIDEHQSGRDAAAPQQDLVAREGSLMLARVLAAAHARRLLPAARTDAGRWSLAAKRTSITRTVPRARSRSARHDRCRGCPTTTALTPIFQ